MAAIQKRSVEHLGLPREGTGLAELQSAKDGDGKTLCARATGDSKNRAAEQSHLVKQRREGPLFWVEPRPGLAVFNHEIDRGQTVSQKNRMSPIDEEGDHSQGTFLASMKKGFQRKRTAQWTFSPA